MAQLERGGGYYQTGVPEYGPLNKTATMIR